MQNVVPGPFTKRPGGLVVVLVEDDNASRGLLTQMLEQLGYEIFAYRSAEALNVGLFFRVRPAIAIVDLMLPGQTGMKVCEMLASARRVFGMKLLLTSSQDEAKLAECAKAAHADGFVTKKKLIDDPAGALRDLVEPPMADADLIEASAGGSPQAAISKAVTKQLEDYQPRVDIRAACQIPVTAHGERDQRFSATMMDLSLWGARLSVEAFSSARLGMPVRLTFSLDKVGDLDVAGKVAWKRPGDKMTSVGVRFVDLSPRNRELIEAYLGQALVEFMKEAAAKKDS